MSLNYDPTAYETWRQNYEMREALAWFGGCIWYFMWGNFMGRTGLRSGSCSVARSWRSCAFDPPYGATT